MEQAVAEVREAVDSLLHHPDFDVCAQQLAFMYKANINQDSAYMTQWKWRGWYPRRPNEPEPKPDSRFIDVSQQLNTTTLPEIRRWEHVRKNSMWHAFTYSDPSIGDFSEAIKRNLERVMNNPKLPKRVSIEDELKAVSVQTEPPVVETILGEWMCVVDYHGKQTVRLLYYVMCADGNINESRTILFADTQFDTDKSRAAKLEALETRSTTVVIYPSTDLKDNQLTAVQHFGTRHVPVTRYVQNDDLYCKYWLNGVFHEDRYVRRSLEFTLPSRSRSRQF